MFMIIALVFGIVLISFAIGAAVLHFLARRPVNLACYASAVGAEQTADRCRDTMRTDSGRDSTLGQPNPETGA